MYIVAFEIKKIDKKVLRSVKPLKSQRNYTIKESQKILKEIHSIINGSVKIPYKLVDNENELEYVFDDITINSSSSVPNLMNIMEDEIISSGHEDSHRIIDEIQKQYQMELDNREIEDNEDIEIQSKHKSKGLNILGRVIKSKKQNVSKKISEDEDFEEIEEESSYINEFDELNVQIDEEQNQCESNEETLQMDTISSDEPYIEENAQEELPFESEEETLEKLKNEDIMIIEDEFKIETNKNAENKVIYKKKNEKIIFPQYDFYLDLSAVNNSIERNKERFKNTHLVKLLGLNGLSTETAQSELDTMKLNYALNLLEESKFNLLKDYLYNSIENIKDKTQIKLAQSYEKAMTFDYEEEANKSIEEEVRELYEETENVFNKYNSEQEEEYKLKLSKFEYEQEKALEEFKKQQGIEKSIYVQDVEAKKFARMILYKDNMQKEINIKKDQLLDGKMYELKNISINQLTETKRIVIRNFEEELEVAVDDAWKNIQAAIENLKMDIETRIPYWQKDIEENRKIEAEKKKEIRKQEALNLQKQQIEIQRKQLEMDSSEKKVEEAEAISKIIERKFCEFDEKINNHYLSKKIELVSQNTSEKTLENNIGKKNKSIITGVAVIALVVIGSVFVGVTLVSNKTKPTTAYYELSKDLRELEEKISTSKTTEKEELDMLLMGKKYEIAISLYKDEESLNKIEETLYKNGDLAMLITFNKTNKTMFGLIDEAILSKDCDKVLEYYTKMSDEVKEQLNSERKSDVAVFYYQKGESEIASTLLGLNDAK